MERELQGKYTLELNLPGDGRTFLNYWDYMRGDDVIAELKDGKLFQDETELTLPLFIELVKRSIKKSNT